MVKQIIPFFICFLFAFFAGFALLHSGMIPTHDGEYHVLRFYEFNKTLSSGVLYPRWAKDFNYGYGIPLFNYVYPLPNYIASLLHLFGLSFIDSFKINMLAALLIGAVGMYLFSKNYWGKLGGIVSSIFYTFAPYHFVDIYIRGSVGEVWALGLFPLFLWTITKTLLDSDKNFLILSAFLLAAIIFSHNILALAFFPFAVTYMFFLIIQSLNKRKSILYSLSVVILGVGLSAIFWLPAIFEIKFVTGLQIFDLKANFPELYQLIIPSWGSGFFGSSMSDQMSVQIGTVNIFVILIILIICPFLIYKRKKYAFLILFLLIWFLILFLLCLQVSLPIWKNIPLLHYFQFPWRLLSLIILLISFLAGAIIYYFKYKIFLTTVFSIIIVSSTWMYASPAHYLYRNDNYYTTRSNFIDSTNSPGNTFNTIWFSEKIKQRDFILLEPRSEKDNIYFKIIKPQEYAIATSTNDNKRVLLSLAYFPGWKVFIDKNQSEILNADGKISFMLPRGNHVVEIIFSETTLEKIASYTSLVALLVLITVIIKNWYSIKYAHSV